MVGEILKKNMKIIPLSSELVSKHTIYYHFSISTTKCSSFLGVVKLLLRQDLHFSLEITVFHYNTVIFVLEAVVKKIAQRARRCYNLPII